MQQNHEVSRVECIAPESFYVTFASGARMFAYTGGRFEPVAYMTDSECSEPTELQKRAAFVELDILELCDWRPVGEYDGIAYFNDGSDLIVDLNDDLSVHSIGEPNDPDLPIDDGRIIAILQFVADCRAQLNPQ